MPKEEAPEKTLLQATVVFLRRDDKVLLARKKAKIGKGCWNGYGGGIEAGETPESAAVRELREESGIDARAEDLRKIAVLFAHNTKSDGTTFICEVHMFELPRWQGAARATEEMDEPTWFPVKYLPVGGMLPADVVWLPRALRGERIIVTAEYGPRQEKLLGEVVIKKATEF